MRSSSPETVWSPSIWESPSEPSATKWSAAGAFRHGLEELRSTGRSLRKLTDTMVSADESPFAENDLMDPVHVPQSIAQSTLKLVESVATWPLRHSILGALYQKLRGIDTSH